MIRTKCKRLYAMVMVGRMALLALAGFGLSGCIIIPTSSHDGVSVITKETIESFEPGKTTRADVLLRLGDPAKRLEEDRFFVYEWKRAHGYLLSMAPQTDYRLVYSHYLGLEFTPDNRMKRVKVIDPWWYSPMDQYPRVEEWMAEERELSLP